MSFTSDPSPREHVHLELVSARAAVQKCFDGLPIDTAIILGSGLGNVAKTVLKNPQIIPYRDIPGMPKGQSVLGHDGALHLGKIGTHRVAFFLGRKHLYQGLQAREVVFPIRLAAALGAQELVLTNAAGSLSTKCKPGDIMLIADHINLTGTSPLEGERPIHSDSPFVSMSEAYSPRLRTEAQWTAKHIGLHFHEGVYVGLRGPQYETQAEAEYLARIGGDAVGMSTVLETIAARALNLKVLALSLLTNRAGSKGNHQDVIRVAAETSQTLATFLAAYLHREELEEMT